MGIPVHTQYFSFLLYGEDFKFFLLLHQKVCMSRQNQFCVNYDDTDNVEQNCLSCRAIFFHKSYKKLQVEQNCTT